MSGSRCPTCDRRIEEADSETECRSTSLRFSPRQLLDRQLGRVGSTPRNGKEEKTHHDRSDEESQPAQPRRGEEPDDEDFRLGEFVESSFRCYDLEKDLSPSENVASQVYRSIKALTRVDSTETRAREQRVRPAPCFLSHASLSWTFFSP